MRVRLKVCCIASVEEAAIAVRLGASAVGLVSAMPSGPGVIDEDSIAAIARAVPPGVARVLLTSATEPERVVDQQARTGVDVLQLVDRWEPGGRDEIRSRIPGVRLIQVVHVTGPGSIHEARDAARGSDALLLDSGRPDAALRELGGTGRVHDWATSRAIREAVEIPVFLAGGLNPGNVADAVAAVGPYGVDVCTGVRTDDRLDPGRLEAFTRGLA